MQVYQTNELLENLYKQTEQFFNKAVSEWQMTSPKTLLKQPVENKWSAAQCIEHLNSYGRYYLPAIEQAIEDAKKKSLQAEEKYKPGLLGNYFTNLMLPKEGKQKKMAAPKEHQPVADLDSDKVISEFIEQQEKLLMLLERAKKIDIGRAKVSISIAKFIKLKLGDVFMFVIAHNYRHIVQAEKALGNSVDLMFASPALA